MTRFGKMCIRSSHIQFFNFEDSQNLLQMADQSETCKVTIPLFQIFMLFLPDFMEHLNKQNWMCELCTFSQIQSHIHNIIYT